jgi:hypothetical protein
MDRAVDEFGRPQLSPDLKKAASAAFSTIPDGKKGTIVLVADKGSDTIQAHVAAKIGDHWKVAAGAGWEWGKKEPDTVFVAVGGSW